MIPKDKEEILKKYGMINNFIYKADYEYFLDKLANGNVVIFENEYIKLFDFRDPKIKRAEFNKDRNQYFDALVEKFGKACQLNLCPDCSEVQEFDVDHFIPLSTNELNKKLRCLKPTKGKKVPSQSFGSNSIENLRIACKRCNAFKKHRIML
ncbi:MAG: HNH endonuclease signature motif containing protein [Candidatus Taylorbacteria bacterium]